MIKKAIHNEQTFNSHHVVHMHMKTGIQITMVAREGISRKEGNVKEDTTGISSEAFTGQYEVS